MGLERFQIKFREQIGFLQRSNRDYDEGHESEAYRLATTLRVLFHNTQQSTSLINHLGLQTTKMVTSYLGQSDAWMGFIKIQISLASSTPVSYLPRLGKEFRFLSLSKWWSSEPVFRHGETVYTRRDVILAAANKDGGAHVDKKLTEFYEALASGTAGFGITGDLKFNGPAPFEQGIAKYGENMHLAMIRQFSHETVVASDHFKWVSPTAALPY